MSMKKITSALFVALMSGLFYTTSAMSELKIGVSAVAGVFNADGTEKEVTETNVSEQDILVTYGEIWIEKSFDQGFGLGLAFIPHSIGTPTEERTDVPLTSVGGTDSGTTSDSGTNKAQADVENHVTLYATVPLGDTGFYGKIGVSHMDVISGESISSGSAYPDVDVYGGSVAIGYERETADVFLRLEIGASSYEEIAATSTTNTANSVTADVTGVTARISIGKAF